MWNTSCPDWERRLLAGESLVPDLPLFKDEAERALRIFKRLRVPDMHGVPRMGDVAGPWLFPIVEAIFGSYDPAANRRAIQEFFWLIPKKNGKALRLDTEVATPDGFKTIADLRVGDFVLSITGKPTRVIDKSPVFINHDCYEVEFSTGEKVVCDGGHLWVTDAHKDRERAHGDRSAPRPSPKTTRQIAESLKVASGRYQINNHRTALPAPLDLPEASLPIPPYALGLWLGNGASSAAAITAHAADADEMVTQLTACGQQAYIRQRFEDRTAATISLAANDSKAGYRFLTEAKRLGVIGAKHIPAAYLRGSYDQRLALLRGLMDSDGTISKAGQASFSTTAPALRDGVLELVNSLGLKGSISEGRAVLNGVDHGPYWIIQFWPFDNVRVFTTRRKFARQRPSAAKNAPRSATRQIVGCRKVESVPVQCISVECPTKQFLITRALIPTHNSSTSAAIMVEALILNRRPEAEFVLVAPTKEIADIAFKQAAGTIRADAELSKLFHIQGHHVRTITHLQMGASLKVKAADTDVITGGKQVGTMIDELHVLASKSNAADIMVELRGALAARPDGFLITVTTQSKKPPQGVFKAELEKARAVRDGQMKLPLLPILYELPQRLAMDGGWRERKYWSVVNPNLGRSVDEAFLERTVQEAEAQGSAQMALIASQHFNVQIGQSLSTDGWPGAEDWEACADPSLTLNDLLDRSEVVTIGVDFGGKDDLFSLCVLGREPGAGVLNRRRWLAWTHSWCHQIAIERRKAEASNYDDFVRAGELTVVERLGQDIDDAVEIISRVYDTGLLAGIGLDPNRVGPLLGALEAANVTGPEGNDQFIAAVTQGRALGGAAISAERKLNEGTLTHAGQAIMAWAVGNAKVEWIGNGLMVTKKASGSAKIDPLMALFDAVFLMDRDPEPQTQGSVYDKRDMLIFRIGA